MIFRLVFHKFRRFSRLFTSNNASIWHLLPLRIRRDTAFEKVRQAVRRDYANGAHEFCVLSAFSFHKYSHWVLWRQASHRCTAFIHMNILSYRSFLVGKTVLNSAVTHFVVSSLISTFRWLFYLVFLSAKNGLKSEFHFNNFVSKTSVVELNCFVLCFFLIRVLRWPHVLRLEIDFYRLCFIGNCESTNGAIWRPQF